MQLLKWIGNKQRSADQIIRYFPQQYNVYLEPFLGSGAVMAALRPKHAVGSDIFAPLIEIWQTLKSDPDRLKNWYATRYQAYSAGDARAEYEKIKAAFNASPNGADFLFLSRACYGGVVRFRKKDGYMSTPCGAHKPMKPAAFSKRVDLWHDRLRGATFHHRDYRRTLADARAGDLVYCDPPYADSQSILYGAQGFDMKTLLDDIGKCKDRGVHVALSLDGTKKSGLHRCEAHIPDGLFNHDIAIDVGRSMLRRFQMPGQSLESEQVHDRLLLTYDPPEVE